MARAADQLIAPCGLDCSICDIKRVPHDADAAGRVLAWFRSEGWVNEGEGVQDIIEKRMYCLGCPGDRSLHWSPDCWILNCCVDEKKLRWCSQCTQFPCEPLVAWSHEGKAYSRALDRLAKMQSR